MHPGCTHDCKKAIKKQQETDINSKKTILLEVSLINQFDRPTQPDTATGLGPKAEAVWLPGGSGKDCGLILGNWASDLAWPGT